MDAEQFDAGRVAALAQDIQRLEREAKSLRKAVNDASNEANRAEVALSNKRSEFTRAVSDQLDSSELARRPSRELRAV